MSLYAWSREASRRRDPIMWGRVPEGPGPDGDSPSMAAVCVRLLSPTESFNTKTQVTRHEVQADAWPPFYLTSHQPLCNAHLVQHLPTCVLPPPSMFSSPQSQSSACVTVITLWPSKVRHAEQVLLYGWRGLITAQYRLKIELWENKSSVYIQSSYSIDTPLKPSNQLSFVSANMCCSLYLGRYFEWHVR